MSSARKTEGHPTSGAAKDACCTDACCHESRSGSLQNLDKQPESIICTCLPQWNSVAVDILRAVKLKGLVQCFCARGQGWLELSRNGGLGTKLQVDTS